MSESNLEDRAAIHDLFTRYCCALDNGEVEAVVDCFTVDAILKSPVIDISGRDEILAFAGCREAGRRRDNRGRRGLHHCARPRVTLERARLPGSATNSSRGRAADPTVDAARDPGWLPTSVTPRY